MQPKQRMVLFHRRQRGIFFVLLLSAFGMLLMARGSFLMYFGMMLSLFIPIAMFVPALLFARAARLIGMPLERAASPKRAALPWHPAASKELWLLGLALAVGLVLHLFPTFRIAGGADFPMATVAIPMLFALGAGLWRANTRGFFPAMLLTQPLFIAGSMVIARRVQTRQRATDFEIAEGMSGPRRFIETLTKVEELQISASGMDPSARNLPLSQRRQRLERMLGLE